MSNIFYKRKNKSSNRSGSEDSRLSDKSNISNISNMSKISSDLSFCLGKGFRNKDNCEKLTDKPLHIQTVDEKLTPKSNSNESSHENKQTSTRPPPVKIINNNALANIGSNVMSDIIDMKSDMTQLIELLQTINNEKDKLKLEVKQLTENNKKLYDTLISEISRIKTDLEMVSHQDKTLEYCELTDILCDGLCKKLEPELNKKIIDIAKIMEQSANYSRRSTSKSRRLIKIVTD